MKSTPLIPTPPNPIYQKQKPEAVHRSFIFPYISNPLHHFSIYPLPSSSISTPPPFLFLLLLRLLFLFLLVDTYLFICLCRKESKFNLGLSVFLDPVAMARAAAPAYVGWEEVVVSGDKGRRVVHYYLRDARGGLHLAVVAREKTVRHMSYAAVPAHVLLLLSELPSSSSSSSLPATVPMKWRSRREVVDWLSSLVVSSDSSSLGYSSLLDRFLDDDEASPADAIAFKGLSSGKMRHHSKEFSWLGSAWTCRKRRKHYRSFCQNGSTISVHDFVFVMDEENKRRVAYVEDLYEDMKARNMVVVRWFNKVNEVNIILPPDVNDREIFFSLCLQDLSVDCVDGLATILGTQHFEKYLLDVTDRNWEPFLCCRQIDNDDVKPFDITSVQGYWNQELIRCMYASPKLRLKLTTSSCSPLNGDSEGSIPQRPKRKNGVNGASGDASGNIRIKFRCLGGANGGERLVSNFDPAASLPSKEGSKQKPPEPLSAGCEVEVLSQDSGIRGCWFRCLVIKRYQDKVKVRYQDVRDADETGPLEEWVMASRVAVSDKLGIWSHGRTIVRPQPPPRSKTPLGFGAGTVVDAWWHDGWWEGIVICKESDRKIHVYFPGEQRVETFGQVDLRYSQDWVCNKWNRTNDRPDLVGLFVSGTVHENCGKDGDGHALPLVQRKISQFVDMAASCKPPTSSGEEKENVPNLARDNVLARLKWSSSRRRCSRGFPRGSRFDQRRQSDGSSSNSSSQGEVENSSVCLPFSISKPLTVDHEKCKFGGDPLFGAPMAISSLVMSQ